MVQSALSFLTDRFAQPRLLWLLAILPALASGWLWIDRRRRRAVGVSGQGPPASGGNG
jgi:hypothetical protein